MKKINNIIVSLSLICFSLNLFAQDITGLWQSIDDKTGVPKGIVKITKEIDQTYTGSIVKITPREGYTPKKFCTGCPDPFKDKPLIGLNVIQHLKKEDNFNFSDGIILDPISGKIYRLKTELSPNGQRMRLTGYKSFSIFKRSQTWTRLN